MNSSKSAKQLAFLGVMFALIFVFLLVETYAFSAFFGNFTPAILTIPVAISLALVGSKRPMLVGGTLLGCSSFLLAIIIGNPIFLNPLISIFPRIFIGLVAYGVYVLLNKFFASSQNKFMSEVFPAAVAGVLGTVTNTVCTIFMMWVFNKSDIASVFTVLISINFVAEVIAAAILTPTYVMLIKKITSKLGV